jgi:hypothetical protein
MSTGLEDSTLVTGGASANCVKQTFPSYTGPIGAPTLGAVAYSVHGVQIYGPFENGFTAGQACTVAKGACVAGEDIDVCEGFLEYDCGVENVKTYMLMDSCGFVSLLISPVATQTPITTTTTCRVTTIKPPRPIPHLSELLWTDEVYTACLKAAVSNQQTWMLVEDT